MSALTKSIDRLPYPARKLYYSLQWKKEAALSKFSAEWDYLRTRNAPLASLVILDDYFPSLLWGYRIIEFNGLLERYPTACVYSSYALNANKMTATGDKRFADLWQEYAALYPHLKDRVHSFHPKRKLRGDLAYIFFLQNAFNFVEYLERDHLPFAFMLFPGGLFRLDNDESDAMLRRVCASPMFRKVIAPNTMTRDYLLKKEFCKPEQIANVHSVVVPTQQLQARAVAKRRFPQNKPTFDLCFVAHKYMRGGLDKGYDLFIEVAKTLCRQYNDIHFHVVGTFDASDSDITGLEDNLHFHGVRQTDFFPEFYADMDIILSPNRPFVLFPGAFDGFPTGCCIEAGLCGVALFCSDPLNLNIFEGKPLYEPDRQMVIIDEDVAAICARIAQYRACPDALYQIAEQGKARLLELFDTERQMQERFAIFDMLLPSNSASDTTLKTTL